MGGFGSTRWACISTKDTVESARSIDINRLNRAGCLQPRYCGVLEWTRNGERIAISVVEWRRCETVKSDSRQRE
jgi:hypothetical protein